VTGVQTCALPILIDSPMLVAEGLHVYDGHINDPDISIRQKKCNDAFLPVTGLMDELKSEGISPVKVVAGGTPTFPVHALRKETELSPGTPLLWDYGYSSTLSDMSFLHAAILLTRIVSKPGKELLCLDLGHKAVASEMPHPRIKILGMEKYAFISHNEEHMVIRTTKADLYKTGDQLYCIPWHICPTVDRHDNVYVIDDHNMTGQWQVDARKRTISI
jgi:D-serine deaminase-like pyridoxal phosphate-dependent protein